MTTPMITGTRSRRTPTVLVAVFLGGCQAARSGPERQKTWHQESGVVDIFRSDKIAARFIDVSEMVADAPSGSCSRAACAYGFGVLDANFNYMIDEGERERFFAVGDYGDRYSYYPSPLSREGSLLAGTDRSG